MSHANLDTYKPLAEFIFHFSDSEKQLLVVISTLLEHPEYSLKLTGRKIAPGGQEDISVENLQSFLKRELEISVSTQELKDFIQFNSPNILFPDSLTSDNFSRLMSYSPFIQRSPFSNSLDLDKQDLKKIRIEDAIARIFKKELFNQRKVKAIRQELVNAKEFSILSAYDVIFDKRERELSDVKKIEIFLNKNGIISNEFDTRMIASRLDRNKDGTISFEDFHLAVLGYPPGSQQDRSDINNMKQSIARRRDSSIEKSLSPHDSNKSREQIDDVLREYERNMSELRKGNSSKSRNEHSNSPSRVSASRRRFYKNFQFNQDDDDKTLDEELLLPLSKLNESAREQEDIIKKKGSSGKKTKSREDSQELTREEIIREYSIGKIVNKETARITSSIDRSLSFSESKTNRATSPYIRDSSRRNSQDAFKNLFAIRSSKNIENVRVPTENGRGFFENNRGPAENPKVPIDIAPAENRRGSFENIGFATDAVEGRLLSEKNSTEKRVSSKENENLEKTTKKGGRKMNPRDKQLVGLVEKLINIERSLETLRADLTLKKHFNTMEVFRMIDASKKSSITVGDFERGFKGIDIHLKLQEVETLFRRFDKDMAGLLRFSDFAEIFKPKAVDTVNKRPPTARLNSSRSEIGENIRALLKDILMTCLSRESVKEQIENSLAELKFKSVLEIFNLVQEENVDLVSLKEFREIMTENSILADRRDLNYLIKKYEK